MSVNLAYKIRDFFVYTFLAIVMLVVLYPFVYVLTAAFAGGNTMTSLSCIPFGNGFSFLRTFCKYYKISQLIHTQLGSKNIFSPSAKVTTMVLKSYTGFSDIYKE